jgi:ribosomal 30S subunit maturation factor RimM
VVVGTLGRAQGLKGEVRVYPVTDQPKKRLSRAGVRLWLQPTAVKGQPVPGSSQLQRVEVQHGRIIKPPTAQDREIWAVKFKGVADRTQVGQSPTSSRQPCRSATATSKRAGRQRGILLQLFALWRMAMLLL